MQPNSRVSDSLKALFDTCQIVFWHDVDGEFSELIENLNLDNVQIVRMDSLANLQIKLQIESAQGQRWLLYSNQAEPEPSKDWLFDIRLRSKSFRADSVSMLLEDLGLTTLSLRSHLKERSRFLRSKDRVEKLKKLVSPSDTEIDLDRKMLAVIARADLTPSFHIDLDWRTRLMTSVSPGEPS